MRPVVRCAAVPLLLLAAAAPAAAQRRAEPQLLLTIFGGVTTGSSLWQIDRQPLSLIEEPTRYDTLLLSRELEAAVSLGAGATYFPSPHLGLTGEIFFMGFGMDDRCEFVRAVSTAGSINDQVCTDITEHGGSASTIAFTVGGLYRFAPRGFAAPYLRVQAGIASRQSSTVELIGQFVDGTGNTQARLVIRDSANTAIRPTGAFGLGVLIPFGRGYQVGFELRDNLVFFSRVTDPADDLANAPTETTLKHAWSLVMRFDIVLEQKRGRRY